ncbi:Ubiquitin-protein ligase [Irineochytrium annulatum]|nr:Ubiquitin-protein ligase [Irineochytrium annulatum]
MKRDSKSGDGLTHSSKSGPRKRKRSIIEERKAKADLDDTEDHRQPDDHAEEHDEDEEEPQPEESSSKSKRRKRTAATAAAVAINGILTDGKRKRKTLADDPTPPTAPPPVVAKLGSKSKPTNTHSTRRLRSSRSGQMDEPFEPPAAAEKKGKSRQSKTTAATTKASSSNSKKAEPVKKQSTKASNSSLSSTSSSRSKRRKDSKDDKKDASPVSGNGAAAAALNADEDDEEMDDEEASAAGANGAAPPRSPLRAPTSSFSFGALFGGGRAMMGGGGVAGAGRFQDLLLQLQKRGTTQLMALQDLAEILSVATEDMFIGHGGSRLAGFNTDEFVRVLLGILETSSTPQDPEAFMDFMDDADLQAFGFGAGGVSPDVLLLACRCLLNLIEAHPSSTIIIVNNRGAEVLVSKIMEIDYIDLAEVALSVIEKISQDYPGTVVKANGLFASLQFIDFFSLHVQRTAVTIVANACQKLKAVTEETISMVKAIIPNLDGLLKNADQKVVEQTVRAMSRIVEWCWKSESSLQSIITTSIIDTMIGLITPSAVGMPGVTNSSTSLASQTSSVGSPFIFSQLLKILSNICRGSANLGAALMTGKSIVDIVFSILTGSATLSSGVDGEEDILNGVLPQSLSSAVTTVVVNRPLDQIGDVLSLAFELLPSLPKDGIWSMRLPKSTRGKSRSPDRRSSSGSGLKEESPERSKSTTPTPTTSKDDIDSRRLALLQANPDAMRSYSLRLLPIFIEVFGTSVSPVIRKRCVECIAKAVWYSHDPDTLASAVKSSTSFGKFVAEVVELYEVAFMKPVERTLSDQQRDEEVSPASGVPQRRTALVSDRDRRDALLFVCAGVQISVVVIDTCGAKFRELLSREGVLSQMSKLIEAAEAFRIVSANSEKPPLSPSKTAPTEAALTEPSRFSEMLKDLKRMRDQVVGQLGPGATPSNSSLPSTSTEAALNDVSELKELLDRADKLVSEAKDHAVSSLPLSSSCASSPERQEAKAVAESDGNASSSSPTSQEVSKKEELFVDTKSTTSVGSAPNLSPSSGAFSMLSGMKKVLERLTKPAPAGSSSGAAASMGSTSPLVGLNGDRFLESEITEWLIATCKRILEASKNEGGHSTSEASVLQELKDLAVCLKTGVQSSAATPTSTDGAKNRTHAEVFPVNDILLLSVLKKVAEHFSGARSEDAGLGVTGFEILESSVIDGLATYITAPGVGEVVTNAPQTTVPGYPSPLIARLRAFLHVFLNGPSPDGASYYVQGAFNHLVLRLQEALSRVERFEVSQAIPGQATSVSAGGSGGESLLNLFGSFLMGGGGGSFSTAVAKETTNPSLQLTRQIKLRLVADEPDQMPNGFKQFMVSIHAVATVKSLDDYLKSRVGAGGASLIEKDEKPAEKAAIAAGAPASAATGDDTTSASAPADDSMKMDGDEEDGDDALDEKTREEDDEDDIEDDYDEDENGEMLNVSDVLLDSERQRRVRRGWSIASGSSGQSGAPLTGEQARRDSVVDVRSDANASTPGSPSPMAVAANIGGSLPPPSKLSTSMAPSNPLVDPPASHQPTTATALSKSSSGFHFQFSIDDYTSTPDQTIFGFLYSYELRRRDGVAKGSPNIWSNLYTVNFKRVRAHPTDLQPLDLKSADGFTSELIKVDDPMLIDSDGAEPIKVKTPFRIDVPQFLKSTTHGNIMFLLRLLFVLNSRWTEVFEEAAALAPSIAAPQPVTAVAAEGGTGVTGTGTAVKALSLTPLNGNDFVNSKLTAKMNRQLDEPLIVACGVMPEWSLAIAKDFSFLVPFDTRFVYLQSTSFGFSRSLGRWQQHSATAQSATGGEARRGSAGRAAIDGSQLGRLQRQKVRIARSRIIDSMGKVMDLYGSNQQLLEVEFFDEVGTGLGPTLEFYSLVCKEIRRREGIPVSLKSSGTSSRSLLTAGLLGVPGGGAATGQSLPTSEKVNIWRDDGLDMRAENLTAEAKSYLNPPGGLFPAPITTEVARSEKGKKIFGIFKSLGTFVAKALLDSRIVDMPFSPLFLEMVIGEESDDWVASTIAHGKKGRFAAEMHFLKHVDSAMHHSLLDLRKYLVAKRAIEGDMELTFGEKTARLAQIRVRDASIEDLCLDFTLPGYSDIELLSDGKNVPVDLSNLESYLEKVMEMTVGEGIRGQVEAFRRGFDRVFPIADLRIFTVQELSILMGGNDNEDWSYETILDALKADHGYTSDSKTIRNLVEMMHSFDATQRREFLMFVTGSPKLPIGGFKALSPSLTVVCKHVDNGRKPDEYLPSVMTCVNYLKVPEYSGLEMMKRRFTVAIREGQGSVMV